MKIKEVDYYLVTTASAIPTNFYFSLYYPGNYGRPNLVDIHNSPWDKNGGAASHIHTMTDEEEAEFLETMNDTTPWTNVEKQAALDSLSTIIDSS